jgi:hypothetical protein
MNLARDDSVTSEPKFKGLVNDAYTRDLFRNEDWDFGKSSSSISASAYYNTGTVSCTAGSAALTGVGTTWTAAMTALNGWKIKFSGQDIIYDFTRTAATTATISPVLSGANDLASAGYTLYRDTYSLVSDFSRFMLTEMGGLQLYKQGRVTSIPVKFDKQWFEDFRVDVSDTVSMCRFNGYTLAGLRRLQINPATKTAIVLPYEYMKILAPMTEYTTGYISAITNGAAAVTGAGATWNSTANIDTATYRYYFRIDGDGTGANSMWYLIDSVGGANAITLATTYAGVTIGAGVSTDTYTISRVPEIPHEFHDWLIYASAYNGIADQGDPNYQYYVAQAAKILTECKMQYKSRRVSQQFSVEDSWRSYHSNG